MRARPDPARIDAIAKQALGAHDRHCGRPDRGSRKPGDPLDVLHGSDQEEPEDEESTEPREPPDAKARAASTPLRFDGHLGRYAEDDGCRETGTPLAGAPQRSHSAERGRPAVTR